MKCRLLRLARANSTARARQLGKVIVGGVYAAKVFQMASILTTRYACQFKARGLIHRLGATRDGRGYTADKIYRPLAMSAATKMKTARFSLLRVLGEASDC